jgi:hypothetical protein
MLKLISIYCCGGIVKGAGDSAKASWGVDARGTLCEALAPTRVVYLDPAHRSDDVANAFTVFGRDHYQVGLCDFFVADLTQRRGIGVGIEMLSAKWQGKPLLAIAPPESHYRRAHLAYLGGQVPDYVHAHLFGVADAIVDDFAAAGAWIKRHLAEPARVKDMSVVTKAIAAYVATQLSTDVPMQAAIRELKSAGRSVDLPASIA